MKFFDQDGNPQASSFGAVAVLFLGALLALIVMFGSWYTVNQGERVVVTRNGAVVDEAGPGLHFKTPWIEGIERFEVRTTKYKEPAFEAYSKDIQPAQVTMSVNLHVAADKVREIYSQYGAGYGDRIVVPATLQAAKETFGKYAAADIVNQRDKIAADVQADLDKKLGVNGIVIETVQIEDIKFSAAFVQSIEQRMQAEIMVKQKEQQLRSAEVDAQTAAAKAKGEADAVKAKADGDSYATTINAKADADAIKIKSDALRASPNYVQFTLAQKWDGALPKTMLPNGATPLIDLRAPKD